MTGFLLDESSKAECPHNGPISFNAGFKKVLINNKPLVTVSDNFVIKGCKIGNHPCQFVAWLSFSNKIFLNGRSALVKGNVGLCLGGIPGFVPQNKISTQQKVKGI